MSKNYLIPHPNVPTSDIGISKMKEVTMLFNENFLALDGLSQTFETGIDGLKSSKAEKDHDHDDDYAAKEHTHSMQEISSLEQNLALKAPLVHTHDQYLTSMPIHTHEQSEINNLISDLAAKADSGHTHGITDIDGLESSLSSKATQTELAKVANMIVPSSGLTEDRFVAVKKTSAGLKYYTTPADQPLAKSGTINNKHFASYSVDDNGKITLVDTDEEVPEEGKHFAVRDNGIETDHLLIGGADGTYEITDSGITKDDLEAVLGAFSIGDESAVLLFSSIPSGTGAEEVAVGNHTHDYSDTYASKATEETVGDHEARILALESAPSGGVNSVNGKTGTVVLTPADIGAAATEDLGDAAYGVIGEDVQAYDAGLTTLASNLSNGKVPLSQLTGNIDGHTGTCYVTIDNNGNLGHSRNKAFTLLDNAAFTSGTDRGANKLITDLDVGNGLEADSTSHNLKVKAKQNGGITVDEYGVSLGGLSGTGFVKSEGGVLSIPSDQPVTATGTGFLKKTATGVAGTAIAITDVTDLQNTLSGKADTSDLGTAAYCASTAFASSGHTHKPADIGAAATSHTHNASDTTDFNSSVDARLTANNVLKSSDKRSSSGSGKLLSTDDVCAAGDVVPCGSGHFVPSSNHKHAPASIGLNSDASVTLDTILKTGTTNINGSKVVFDNSYGNEKVAVISSSGVVSASSSDYAKLTNTAPSSVGTSNSVGTATEAARQDHVHALPTMSGRTGNWTLAGSNLFQFVSNGDGTYNLQFKGIKFDKYGRCLGAGDSWANIATNIYVA